MELTFIMWEWFKTIQNVALLNLRLTILTDEPRDLFANPYHAEQTP